MHGTLHTKRRRLVAQKSCGCSKRWPRLTEKGTAKEVVEVVVVVVVAVVVVVILVVVVVCVVVVVVVIVVVVVLEALGLCVSVCHENEKPTGFSPLLTFNIERFLINYAHRITFASL
ncbi:hypothetical protein ElyMa_006640300 [Elysia marginata]|uniref:Uncharacterized protein n=1 Tax=Elysia marginata TaxID=1093978 RepID=A0AAV4IK93_9GAST|nr:hypothetical protein ElyMa_006640300 [Elysia marginata]